MKLFDRFVEDSFKKKNASGNTLFYAWGFFLRGYVISSEETLQEIRNLFKKFNKVIMLYVIYIIVLFVPLITSSLIPIIITLIVFTPTVLILIWYYFCMNKILKNTPRMKEKLKLLNSIKHRAGLSSWKFIIIDQILMFAMIAMGIRFLEFESDGFYPLFFICFGVFGVVFHSVIILVKFRQR